LSGVGDSGARLCPARRGISRSGNFVKEAEEFPMTFGMRMCCGWSSADTAALRLNCPGETHENSPAFQRRAVLGALTAF